MIPISSGKPHNQPASPHQPQPPGNPIMNNFPQTRREMLQTMGVGFGSLGLAALLADESPAATTSANPLAPKAPHYPAKAKRIIHLFMNGGPSQVDTFDYKPSLTRHHGSPYHGEVAVGSNGRPIGHLMQSPFPFRRHGQSGLHISSLYPHLSHYRIL